MKKVFSCALSLIFAFSGTQVSFASIAAGQKCNKINQKSLSAGKTFVCSKTNGKLTWKIVTVKPKPVPSVPKTPEAISPTAAADTSIDSSIKDLWVRYKWTKKTKIAVMATSTDAFSDYIATKRSPNQTVTVLAQEGADPTLVSWIKSGSALVASSFKYPNINGSFYDVIGLDSAWLEKTYASIGFTSNEIADRMNGWNAGSPAFGGSKTNTWNSSSIISNNLMVRDRIGMAQTAGHEFFHAIQEMYAKTNPGPNGEKIPNWVWEGPANFVGINTAVQIGAITMSEGRQNFVDRYNNGAAINRSSNLIDIKGNDGIIDPYAIGYVATELIVANVGMEKLINIYEQLGSGKNFSDAFFNATGVPLEDFYTMFEEVRAELGFSKR